MCLGTTNQGDVADLARLGEPQAYMHNLRALLRLLPDHRQACVNLRPSKRMGFAVPTARGAIGTLLVSGPQASDDFA